MVPSITSVTPTSGHTGGQTLIELVGTGFQMPYPLPPTGPTPPKPLPTVSVTIGGAACKTVWVISPTLLRALTPIHDPSGIPAVGATAAIPPSDVVVQNLDESGQPIAGETATLPQAYSFVRPVLNASVVTMTELAIKQLVTEVARQVHPNVQFQPHTDYDPTTGDGLNICDFASLPGIGLTGLRLPTSKDIGDREQAEVELGGGLVAVRRQPVIRDAVLTCLVVSDSTRELMWLELIVKEFAAKNMTLFATNPDGSPLLDNTGTQLAWTLDYQRGEPITFNDRQNGVEWLTSEFAIRRIQETDMPGLPTAGTSGDTLGLHEATQEIAYKVERVNIGRPGSVT